MLRKLLPIILLLIGSGAGIGAGIALRPAPDPDAELAAAEAKPEVPAAAEVAAETATREYVKMNNQFVVPIVGRDEVTALVVLTLSLEVPAGGKPVVYEQEPKLRDSFLQVLFDHANTGGFDGAFTNATTMEVLRRNLLEIAQRDLGDAITDVLILDIARQDY